MSAPLTAPSAAERVDAALSARAGRRSVAELAAAFGSEPARLAELAERLPARRRPAPSPRPGFAEELEARALARMERRGSRARTGVALGRRRPWTIGAALAGGLALVVLLWSPAALPSAAPGDPGTPTAPAGPTQVAATRTAVPPTPRAGAPTLAPQLGPSALRWEAPGQELAWQGTPRHAEDDGRQDDDHRPRGETDVDGTALALRSVSPSDAQGSPARHGDPGWVGLSVGAARAQGRRASDGIGGSRSVRSKPPRSA